MKHATNDILSPRFGDAFARSLRQSSPEELHAILENVFWEIPPESTPTLDEVREIRRLIDARPDVGACKASIKECREYSESISPRSPMGKGPTPLPAAKHNF